MQWTKLLLVVLIGIVLSAACLCLTMLGLRYTHKVYHTDRETKTFADLELVFAITTISTVVLILTTETLMLPVFKLAGLLIISMMAYFYILAGRIPLFFMISAFLLGFAFRLGNRG